MIEQLERLTPVCSGLDLQPDTPSQTLMVVHQALCLEPMDAAQDLTAAADVMCDSPVGCAPDVSPCKARTSVDAAPPALQMADPGASRTPLPVEEQEDADWDAADMIASGDLLEVDEAGAPASSRSAPMETHVARLLSPRLGQIAVSRTEDVRERRSLCRLPRSR